ncbi:hypothetical protein NDA13_002269 [Ustilago tritici]|nr:hypothetical protein NDA13_002269 [Ustilago tritici]
MGLCLSPKKTFGASNKLKVLGVEIDTVAQTVGITNDQCHRILAQCRSLLQRRSEDLLDMQQIAGLLQFVTLSPSLLTAAHIWTDACPKGYGGYLGLNTSPTAVFAKIIPSAVPSCARCTILPPGTRSSLAGPPPGVATSLGISACAANLLWHGLAASTCRRAGGAHVNLGLDTSGFSCGRLECALHGYKRLHSVGHSGAKLPVTLLLLCQVLLAMGKMANLFPQDRLVLQVAFALTFACFLRSGKLVWDCGTDHATILTVSSVDCPVARLWHLSHGRPPSVLLFGLGPSGLNPLPRSTFVTILRHAIQACGLLALQYAGHSFCHGAATWALQHGASTANIQSLGWWSSNCYHHYIDRLAQECHALVASALFSIRNGPLVPSSPTWRDPGLA